MKMMNTNLGSRARDLVKMILLKFSLSNLFQILVVNLKLSWSCWVSSVQWHNSHGTLDYKILKQSNIYFCQSQHWNISYLCVEYFPWLKVEVQRTREKSSFLHVPSEVPSRQLLVKSRIILEPPPTIETHWSWLTTAENCSNNNILQCLAVVTCHWWLEIIFSQQIISLEKQWRWTASDAVPNSTVQR